MALVVDVGVVIRDGDCDTKVAVPFDDPAVATRDVVLWLVVTSWKLGEIGRDVEAFLHVL